MRIAICDDSPEYIKIIESYFDIIKQDNKSLDYDIFEDGTELIAMYESETADYDVIFLDMEMKDMNGIETANIIRQFDEYVIIVFVTSYRKYMQDSFICSPFRFLVKPINLDDIKKVYEEIILKFNKRPPMIVFTENGKQIRMRSQDIVFCESFAHYVQINMKECRYKVRITMQELYDKLGNVQFFRVHKSYIINFEYIKEISKTNVKLFNYDNSIPISRNYRKAFIDGFNHYKERRHLI